VTGENCSRLTILNICVSSGCLTEYLRYAQRAVNGSRRENGSGVRCRCRGRWQEAVAGTVTEAVAVGPGLWRPGPESGMGQAPEDREDGIEQGQCGCDGGLVHIAPGYGNGQMGADFPGGASRDSVVMESILARAPGSFSDVARHRGAGAFELQGQIPVVKADALDRRPERAGPSAEPFRRPQSVSSGTSFVAASSRPPCACDGPLSRRKDETTRPARNHRGRWRWHDCEIWPELHSPPSPPLGSRRPGTSLCPRPDTLDTQTRSQPPVASTRQAD